MSVSKWLRYKYGSVTIDFSFQFKATYCLLFTLSFLLYFAGWKSVAFMVGHSLIVYAVCAIFKSVITLWICCISISFSLQIKASRVWQVSNNEIRCEFGT